MKKVLGLVMGTCLLFNVWAGEANVSSLLQAEYNFQNRMEQAYELFSKGIITEKRLESHRQFQGVALETVEFAVFELEKIDVEAKIFFNKTAKRSKINDVEKEFSDGDIEIKEALVDLYQAAKVQIPSYVTALEYNGWER